MLKNKAAGFYFIMLAGIAAVISFGWFMLWAPVHNGMDLMIVAGLMIGFLADVILVFKDHPFLAIGATAAYSVAVVKLLTNSVGSFVDAFQGIHMFGDATQVNTVISMAAVIGSGILFSIIASFLNRVKP